MDWGRQFADLDPDRVIREQIDDNHMDTRLHLAQATEDYLARHPEHGEHIATVYRMAVDALSYGHADAHSQLNAIRTGTHHPARANPMQVVNTHASAVKNLRRMFHTRIRARIR